MKENRYDKILAKMFNRIERVSDKMAREFKGTNPFDKEKISNEQRIWNYQQLVQNPEIETQLRQAMGDEPVDNLHFQMQQLMQRRNKNA